MAQRVDLGPVWKRGFDIGFAVIGLILTVPFAIPYAILLKRDSSGPLLLRHWRMGRGEKPFRTLTLRTAVPSRIDDLDDSLARRLGRLLRRYRLNELPHLWNVLVGTMSIVGPSVALRRHQRRFPEEYRQVLQVRPGLIGLEAQPAMRPWAIPREETSEPKRTARGLPEELAVGLEYVRRHNLGYDLRTLLKAITHTLRETEHPKPVARAGQWVYSHRRAFVVLLHIVLFSTAFVLSFGLRFDLPIPPAMASLMWTTLPILVLIRVLTFAAFRLYEGLWKYVGIWDVVGIVKAVTISSLAFSAAVLLFVGHGFPRSVVVADWLLCLTLTAGVRMVARLYREVVSGYAWREGKAALIVGAGDAAEMLLREIERSDELDYEVVGFVDNDAALRNERIRSIPVLGELADIPEICRTRYVQEVLIALPSASGEFRRTIVDLCREAGVPSKTVPSLWELLDGKARIGQLKDVQPDDLLERNAVCLDDERVRGVLHQQSVLVTGAAGSIGSELCRQIAAFGPRKLVLFDRAESALYFMGVELERAFPGIPIVTVVGDILDAPLIDEVLREQRPQVIYHAAAYKHVPLMEAQPLESIRNNLMGTELLARAALRRGVKKFVLISTDKAVDPVGIMGMTKNAAECLLLSLNGSSTTFTAVRFGNVLGSNGSVLPLFERQIAMGGPVTVTDPEATRYFMLVTEAAQLVLQASAMGRGGELFFLDMGKPVRIMDMAQSLIRLHGFEPDQDVAVQVIGLRPGERLNESLLMEKEELMASDHTKVFVVVNRGFDREVFQDDLGQLKELVSARDAAGAVNQLKHMVGAPREPRVEHLTVDLHELRRPS